MYKMINVNAMEVRDETIHMDNQAAEAIMRVGREFWARQDPEKKQRVPLQQLAQRILRTSDADGVPNGLVLDLLRRHDSDHDGYIDYQEFMRFVEASGRRGAGREGLTRAALSVLPRRDRTIEKRRYLEYYKCCPPPLFVITSALVQIGVFVYYAVDMGQPMGAAGPAPLYSPLIYNPYHRYEAWRYLSYSLIHSGWVHITTNLVMGTTLGALLELVHGWWRVGLVWWAGVLAGSLAHSITAPAAYLAGASGGVYAVVYAHSGNLLLNWSEMEYRWLQLLIVAIFSILDFSFAIWDTYFAPVPSNTGHWAHLGGAVAGLLVGVAILRNLERLRWERVCWWVSFVIFLILVTAAVILNATLKDFFPDDDYTSVEDLRASFMRRS